MSYTYNYIQYNEVSKLVRLHASGYLTQQISAIKKLDTLLTRITVLAKLIDTLPFMVVLHYSTSRRNNSGYINLGEGKLYLEDLSAPDLVTYLREVAIIIIKTIYPPCLKAQESPANAKGTRDSSACMKAHCEQM